MAVALNDAGTVVGRADISPSSSVHHAFRWQGGKMIRSRHSEGRRTLRHRLFDQLAQPDCRRLRDVCTTTGPSFLWENGTMYNLVSLVIPGSDLTLEGVRRINDQWRDFMPGIDGGRRRPCVLAGSARRTSLLTR